MPTVRVMADGRSILATPGQADRYGIPMFRVGGGNTVKLVIDYTGFLGLETYASGSWTIANATLGTTTASGGIVSALLVMPEILLGEYIPVVASSENTTACSIVHRLVTTEGRIQNTPVRFWLQPATATDVFILDGSYLA